MLAKRVSIAALSLGVTVFSQFSLADIWVFEPSLTLDQRLDDNYYLVPSGAGSLSATRAVGEIGVSRESQTYVMKGLARVDGLLTTNTDVGDENLDSNQIFALNYRQQTARSRYGVRVNYKRDTPSRDIAADISDDNSAAEDTGLLVTQNASGEITQSLFNNVPRKEIIIEPEYTYDFSRRLELTAGLEYTDVDHDRPEAQDVIYQRYLDVFTNSGEAGSPLPYDQVTIEDVGVFTSNGELDDFKETELTLGARYKLSPISTASAKLSYGRLNSNIEFPEEFVSFEQKTPDPDVREILRNPRRDSLSTTSKFILGFERFLTPTIQWVIDGGVYNNESEVLLPEDIRDDLSTVEATGSVRSDGWLASTTLTYDSGAFQYKGRFAVDVQPSSAGSQVETNELTGELKRVLSARSAFSFRARAFEPDRVGARAGDRFARRFISFEPRIQWNYTRNWTLSAAYRYRRQKARIDVKSAESNAVLFAIKYTPPSEIRDAARENGL